MFFFFRNCCIFHSTKGTNLLMAAPKEAEKGNKISMSPMLPKSPSYKILLPSIKQLFFFFFFNAETVSGCNLSSVTPESIGKMHRIPLISRKNCMVDLYALICKVTSQWNPLEVIALSILYTWVGPGRGFHPLVNVWLGQLKEEMWMKLFFQSCDGWKDCDISV